MCEVQANHYTITYIYIYMYICMWRQLSGIIICALNLKNQHIHKSIFWLPGGPLVPAGGSNLIIFEVLWQWLAICCDDDSHFEEFTGEVCVWERDSLTHTYIHSFTHTHTCTRVNKRMNKWTDCPTCDVSPRKKVLMHRSEAIPQSLQVLSPVGIKH